MKKGVAVLLPLLLVLSIMLTACGTTSNSTDVTSDSTSQETPEESKQVAEESEGEEPEGNPYEVIMTFITLGNTPADLELVQEEVNKIALEKTNTTVSLLPIALSEATQKYNLMLSSGEKLDLMLTFLTGVGEYVNKGYLLELDDLVEERGQDILEAEGIAMGGGYFGGKLYAIPSEEKMGRSYGIGARTDLIEKYNFDVEGIKSYDDLEYMFKTIKENEPDIIPFALVGQSEGAARFMMQIDDLGSSVGTGVLMDGGMGDTTIVNLFETEEYKYHVTKMREWYNAGYIPQDALTTNETPVDLIKAGRAFCGTLSTEPGMAENLTRDVGMPMTAITTVDKYATSSMFQISMWSIPATCENPEKTMDFLNLTYESEGVINLLSNGIEGKHYVKTDYPMIITYPEGVTVGTTGYNMPLGIFGDKMKKYAWAPTSPDIFDQLREFNEEVSTKYASKALGYTFNSESVKTEVAAISNIISEYLPALETGTVDPEVALPEFIEKLKSAGIDKVIEENQRQLDAWLAEKE